MSRYDFETLMRYVDGELDDQTCTDLEAWLPSDPAARKIIADLRAQRVELKASYLNEPRDVASGALAAINSGFAERGRKRRRHVLLRRWVQPLAASIMIACVGGMAGYILAFQQINPAIDRVVEAITRDDEHLSAALAEVLEHRGSGEAANWTNPESGTIGSIKPLRTFQNSEGQWCREFEHVMQSRTGDTQTIGIACRDTHGRWQLVHERPSDA